MSHLYFYTFHPNGYLSPLYFDLTFCGLRKSICLNENSISFIVTLYFILSYHGTARLGRG